MIARASIIVLAIATLTQHAAATSDTSTTYAGERLSDPAHIADLPKSRSLLDHTGHSDGPAPAPAPANASAPAGIRNLTTSFATVYGNAYNPLYDVTGGNVNSYKNKASGYMCVIFGTATSASCENEDRPVPACCSSQQSDAYCNSFDDGGRVTCTLSNQLYPACCENRNQPQSACTLAASDKSCNNDYPVPGCCDGTLCTVFKSGDSVQCTNGNVARCCPS